MPDEESLPHLIAMVTCNAVLFAGIRSALTFAHQWLWHSLNI